MFAAQLAFIADASCGETLLVCEKPWCVYLQNNRGGGSVTCGEKPAQRLAPVPRGLQGHASSDGTAPPQSSSR
jgi:hypothetical protein